MYNRMLTDQWVKMNDNLDFFEASGAYLLKIGIQVELASCMSVIDRISRLYKVSCMFVHRTYTVCMLYGNSMSLYLELFS